MSVASPPLVIDYSPLTDFYRRHIWTHISFLLTSQQSCFFNLVEVSCNCCPLFHRTIFCENLPMFVRYSPKQFANLVNQSKLWLDSRLTTSRSHHSITSFVHLYCNHKLRYTNQNASFTLFICVYSLLCNLVRTQSPLASRWTLEGTLGDWHFITAGSLR